MALNLAQKKEVVAELANVAASAHSLVAAEYLGLTVEQLTELRKKAREAGVYLKVAKNTLVRRAVEGTDYAGTSDQLVGPLLYAFSVEDPGAAGRLVKEFAKANDKLKAKIVAVGGQGVSGLARRSAGLAADPRPGPQHAAQRHVAAGHPAGPPVVRAGLARSLA